MSATSYRKKPIVVEALQWDNENYDEVIRFAGNIAFMNRGGTLVIKTKEGNMFAAVNDWIIKGIKGEFYPCKPDIFQATYEELKTHEQESKNRKSMSGDRRQEDRADIETGTGFERRVKRHIR